MSKVPGNLPCMLINHIINIIPLLSTLIGRQVLFGGDLIIRSQKCYRNQPETGLLWTEYTLHSLLFNSCNLRSTVAHIVLHGLYSNGKLIFTKIPASSLRKAYNHGSVKTTLLRGGMGKTGYFQVATLTVQRMERERGGVRIGETDSDSTGAWIFDVLLF